MCLDKTCGKLSHNAPDLHPAGKRAEEGAPVTGIKNLAPLDSHPDLPDVRGILQRVAAENQEASFVAACQAADFAFGEEREKPCVTISRS